MKRIFTFAIALLSMFATTKAATGVFNITVPSPTYQCWVVGNFNGWNQLAMTQCTMVDATHYTVTLDEANFTDKTVTLATLQYKYCSGNGDWAYVEKDAAGAELAANRTFTASPTTDVVAKWAVVYNPTVLPKPMNVTIDVLVPKGTFQCYIVGTFNNWAGPTAPVDSCKMVLLATNTDGTMIFEKKIFTADANKLAYHFCCGPDWSFEQLAPIGDYKYPELNPVVTSWKAIYDPTTTGNINIVATVPATGTGPDVWIQGGFNGWSWDSPKAMTKNTDGTFSYALKNLVSTEYKIYNGTDWNHVEVDASNIEVANRSVSATPGQTITANITVIGWKTLTALNEVNMNNYRIYTLNRSIVVEGVTSGVNLYDASGRAIQSVKTVGTFNSKNLNSGLYILVVDGASRKVALK